MGKNTKADSLKVPLKALKILKQYKQEKDETDLVFPELKNEPDLSNQYEIQKRIKRKLKVINDALNLVREKVEVEKPMTMHISRHTFGNISGDKIPIQMLQKLYRHSSITTTISYQANFIHKDADDALDAVISF